MRQLLQLVLAFLWRDLWMVRPWAWIAEWFNSGLVVVFWYLLTRFVQVPSYFGSGSRMDYFTFSLIGLVFSQYVWRCLSAFVNRVKLEQSLGSLESWWVTATPFPLLVVLSGTWIFLASTVDAGIILVMGKWVFGAPLQWIGILQILGIGILTSLAMGSLGLLTSSWIIISGRGDVFRPLLNQLIPLLSGAFFPIALFPAWLTVLAWGLPITHALRLARGVLMEGGQSVGMQWTWMALVVMTGVLSVLGWAVLTLATRLARINGRISASI